MSKCDYALCDNEASIDGLCNFHFNKELSQQLGEES